MILYLCSPQSGIGTMAADFIWVFSNLLFQLLPLFHVSRPCSSCQDKKGFETWGRRTTTGICMGVRPRLEVREQAFFFCMNYLYKYSLRAFTLRFDSKSFRKCTSAYLLIASGIENIKIESSLVSNLSLWKIRKRCSCTYHFWIQVATSFFDRRRTGSKTLDILLWRMIVWTRCMPAKTYIFHQKKIFTLYFPLFV